MMSPKYGSHHSYVLMVNSKFPNLKVMSYFKVLPSCATLNPKNPISRFLNQFQMEIAYYYFFNPTLGKNPILQTRKNPILQHFVLHDITELAKCSNY